LLGVLREPRLIGHGGTLLADPDPLERGGEPA